MQRLLDATNLTLTSSNWRSVLFGALLLASKIWDDMRFLMDFCVVLCLWEDRVFRFAI